MDYPLLIDPLIFTLIQHQGISYDGLIECSSSGSCSISSSAESGIDHS